jgi:transposase
MGEVRTIGVDLAKSVVQGHGADAAGAVLVRQKLRRPQVLTFFAAQPPCTVALEACGSAPPWARAIGRLGHGVRLIPPADGKPFVTRQKNDAAAAEAIGAAAQSPTMRFVGPQSEPAQAAALVFRARDLRVTQRTQILNALRGHLTEFGIGVANGPAHGPHLVRAVADGAEPIPERARPIRQGLIERRQALDDRIAGLARALAQRAQEDETARRRMTLPGGGPVTATAQAALAPPAFTRGRDCAAWVGLTPLPHSPGGKQTLGATSKMGARTLRRVLIRGARGV